MNGTGRLAEVEAATNTARGKKGRFARVTRCDGCGKPVTGQHFTDDRVCGGTDGPGFFLCDRKRCVEQLRQVESESGIDGLRMLYEERRCRNAVRA